MNPIVFSLFDPVDFATTIHSVYKAEIGIMNIHRFPDEEILIKINSEVKDREVIIVADLSRPDPKFLPLLFTAETLRDLGAKSVRLVAPYLPYMRQDKRFNPGEGISSRYFAKLLSENFNGLITVDPHLHRFKTLDAIYTLPSTLVHAQSSIATWIKNNISHPLLVGPDDESEQWIASTAAIINAPYVVAQKSRLGDTDVKVELPNLKAYPQHTPILLDDIISSGQTLLAAIKVLKETPLAPAICIGIHAIFAGDAYQDLLATGSRVLSCNTIFHPSNAIDLRLPIAQGLMANTQSIDK